MKVTNIKTLLLSMLFLTSIIGLELSAEYHGAYYNQPYQQQYRNGPENREYYGYGNGVDTSPNRPQYDEERYVQGTRYRRGAYYNDTPFIGAGASREGVGARVGPVGVGIGSY